MNDAQFAEMYAINLFNQEEAAKLWENPGKAQEKRTWQGISKKERNKYRNLADDILEEIE